MKLGHPYRTPWEPPPPRVEWHHRANWLGATAQAPLGIAWGVALGNPGGWIAASVAVAALATLALGYHLDWRAAQARR